VGKITGGELIKRILVNEGVKYVFGVPGADLFPALKGEGSLRSRGLHPFYGCYSIIPQADIAGEIGSRSSCFKG